MEQKINIEPDDPDERIWTTCCSRTESSLLKFITQVVMSFGILAFAMIQLLLGKNDPIYINLILIITGIWLPSPRHD
jgi:hypothetical protein